MGRSLKAGVAFAAIVGGGGVSGWCSAAAAKINAEYVTTQQWNSHLVELAQHRVSDSVNVLMELVSIRQELQSQRSMLAGLDSELLCVRGHRDRCK